ncbi:MAG: integrase core domain-containing protein [Polyangiaceae bacterium]|nr:integrase core domain-containing protein [Polyangiaceae bacterium]
MGRSSLPFITRPNWNFRGIALSFAYVKQPETNGVTERFNTNLREQVVHRREYTNVGELREAIARFVPLYNSKWRVEKLEYMTPLETREGNGQQSAA